MRLLTCLLLVLSLVQCLDSKPEIRGEGQGEGVKRVGLLAMGMYWKGLFRDAEIMAWALTHRTPFSPPPLQISVFYTTHYRELEAGVAQHGTHTSSTLDDGGSGSVLGRLALPGGVDLKEWMEGLDALVSFESPMLSVFELARTVGVRRSVLLVNADWSHDKELYRISGVENLCLWSKGPATEDAVRKVLAEMRDADIAASRDPGKAGVLQRVPWTISDTVVSKRIPLSRDAVSADRPVTFLMIVGMGGVQSRRGVDIALRAFHRAMRTEGDGANIHFTLATTLYPFPVEAHLLSHPNVTVLYQVHAREELRDLLAEADAILYPSRWEGFGLTLMEALHAGLPVLATDGWPMNELVRHERNGLLLSAADQGKFFAEDHECFMAVFDKASCKVQLSTRWEVDEAQMASSIIRFASSEVLRSMITCTAAASLRARQDAFATTSRSLMLSLPLPHIAIVHTSGCGCGLAAALRKRSFITTEISLQTHDFFQYAEWWSRGDGAPMAIIFVGELGGVSEGRDARVVTEEHVAAARMALKEEAGSIGILLEGGGPAPNWLGAGGGGGGLGVRRGGGMWERGGLVDAVDAVVLGRGALVQDFAELGDAMWKVHTLDAARECVAAAGRGDEVTRCDDERWVDDSAMLLELLAWAPGAPAAREEGSAETGLWDRCQGAHACRATYLRQAASLAASLGLASESATLLSHACILGGADVDFAKAAVWLMRSCNSHEAMRAAAAALRMNPRLAHGAEDYVDDANVYTGLLLLQRDYGPLCAEKARHACMPDVSTHGDAQARSQWAARVALWWSVHEDALVL